MAIASSIIAAGIAGAAGLGAAAIGSRGASRAADAQTQAANQNNALQAQIYNANSANAQPFLNRGNQAAEALQALLGLLDDDDGAAQQEAFERFLGSSDYQFQVDQGVRAITGNRAARGALDSGGTLKALTQYGQSMGRNALGGYMDRLFNISGQGSNAMSALAGVGQSYANAVSANNNSAADARSNAALASSGQWSGALSQLGGLAGYAFGQSSYGKPEMPKASPYAQGFAAANALVRGW